MGAETTEAPPVPDRWMRIGEAAKYMKVSRSTMELYIKHGVINSVHRKEPWQVQGIKWVDRESIDAYWEAKPTPTPDN